MSKKHSNIPPDARERERVKKELDVCFLVEAGAGSGKTSCLVDRAAAVIAAGKCRPEETAAITFTRKAAAEMKFRLRKKLSTTDKTLLQKVTSEMFVGTIHSFCASMLRETPMFSEVDPGFKEMDEAENIRTALDFFYNTLEIKAAQGDPVLMELEEAGINPSELEGTFMEVCNNPDVEIAFDPYAKRPDPKEAVSILTGLARHWAGKIIRETEPAGGWNGFEKFLLSLNRKVHGGLLENYGILIDTVNSLNSWYMSNSKRKITIKRWPSKDTARAAQEAAENAAEKLVLWLDSAMIYRHSLVMKLLIPAAEELARIRRTTGRLNFTDLLYLTAHMLEKNISARKYFQEKYKTILVDEFQDVDPLQAKIIFLLCSDDPEESVWNKVKLRPGSLFCVGDPRQSIYRFRRADSAVYNEAKRIILESKGEVLKLTANFRSEPKIIDYVNKVFTSLDRKSAGVDFTPMHPALSTESDESGVFVLSPEEKEDEPDLIASLIAFYITEHNYSPSDFMILLERKNHLQKYADALEKRKIPCVVSGASPVDETEGVVAALLNVLKSVVNPWDEIALLAALRGPLFRIDDISLEKYVEKGGKLSTAVEPKDTACVVSDTLKMFRRWSETAKCAPPLSFIMQVAEESGALAVLYSSPRGRAAAALIFDEASKAALEGKNAAHVVDRIERILSYSEEIPTSGGIEDENCVKIMNVHKAKGLEAKVVFLASPGKKGASSPPVKHVKRKEEPPRMLLSVIKAGDMTSKKPFAWPHKWKEAEAEENRLLKEEKLRFYYVAATRAENMLVISDPDINPRFWDLLLTGCEDVPELDVQYTDRAVSLPTAKHRERCIASADINAMSRKSVEYKRVSDVISDQDTYRTPGTGYGEKWGRAVHICLEEGAKARTKDPDNLPLERILKDTDLHEEENLQKMRALLNSVFSHPLWHRIVGSEEILTEVPFVMRDKDGTFVRGTVDLLFKERDGWVALDYKTGAPSDKDAAQISVYARAAEGIGKCNIREKLIFYVSTHEVKKI